MIKQCIVNALLLIDQIIVKSMGCVSIPGSKFKLLNICYIQHKGEILKFEDGTIIQKGDLVGEIHLSNIGISCGKVGDTIITSELQLLGIIRAELKLLSELIQKNQITPHVLAYCSISLLGAGAKRLGFSIIDIPQTFKIRRMALWMSILRRIFAPSFVKRGKNHTKHKTASEIWITETKLFTLLS
jgi:hypothetical protein